MNGIPDFEVLSVLERPISIQRSTIFNPTLMIQTPLSINEELYIDIDVYVIKLFFSVER